MTLFVQGTTARGSKAWSRSLNSRPGIAHGSWQLAERFERAGQTWTGQAIKAAIALSKGEA